MDQDFVRDQNPTAIYHADREHGLPEYVKQAEFMEPHHLEDLHESAFADRVKKLHPIHNKVAALLSGVYLAGNGKNSGKVWDAVKSACTYWGVEDDLETLSSVFNIKSASSIEEAHEKWAVVVKWNEDETGQYYPLNDAEQIKESAMALDQDYNRDKMPVELFRMGALNIVKEAKALNIDARVLPRTVWEMGQDRTPNLDYADLMLHTRKEAGVNEEGMSIYQQCLDIAKEAGTDEAIENAVSLWRDLDEQHGLSYRKQAGAKNVPSPYECFYTGMTVEELEKTASEHIVLKGVMIPINDFIPPVCGNSYESISREFSKEAAEQVLEAVKPLTRAEDVSKVATEVSLGLAELEDWQQSRVLEIVHNWHDGLVEKSAMQVGMGSQTANPSQGFTANLKASPTTPTPVGHGSQMAPVGQNIPVQTQPNPQAPTPIGNGNQMAMPGQGVQVQTTPTLNPSPTPDVDWNAQFQKYHGTSFDPNSTMDRSKLERMQQLMAQHGELNPGLVYA